MLERALAISSVLWLKRKFPSKQIEVIKMSNTFLDASWSDGIGFVPRKKVLSLISTRIMP